MKGKEELQAFLQNNGEVLLKVAARRRLSNFARYVKPKLQLTEFHKAYYSVLDEFAAGRIRRLIVQAPPQHGKSEGSSRVLPAFMLGRNPDLQLFLGSYSQFTASDFCSDVQRIIASREYVDLFPGTRLQFCRSTFSKFQPRRQLTRQRFEVVGHSGWMLALGRGGGLTSKTVDVAILDDLYKDFEEASSPVIRESVWHWYTTVVESRLHNLSQVLIVFTRWHEEDIIGKLEKKGEKFRRLSAWADVGDLRPDEWAVVNFPALKETAPTEIDPRQPGAALWPERHSPERLLRIRKIDPVQFEALYQGDPGSKAGKLYTSPFRTYVTPSDYGEVIRRGCSIDTAGRGTDFLFAATYDIVKGEGKAFNEKTKKWEPILYALIRDCVFSQDGPEVTEFSVASLINRDAPQKVWVEGNAGGEIFAANVAKRVRVPVETFPQTGNKEARIISHAAAVNAQIVWPHDWRERFPAVYEQVTKFLRFFKANAHDDVPDVLTGIYEKELEGCDVRPYAAQRRGVRVR